MLAEYDPIIQEHVINSIQNVLIILLGSAIKSEIIRRVKRAKYFSVILDCTPDVSHQEQMSLILRYVNVSSNPITVEESFLGFFGCYDNGSNMKGKHQGVQKKLLEINSTAFYTP
ncbi:hypothetical protein DCAR_0101162 [Daucus carota subsp. sativus]|uniref:DUF4371 domain-containing protein n=1 Tax=Daucus carota subsp. sativus TaxID=79200 RepID=A0AAF1AGD5_DAUCS|nr:hypothetical protein DCAR_0101162 [Daucus carota subsp. sativus]